MSGLYVHIPFCQRKCSYCDFYSITSSNKIKKLFLNNLQTEIHLRTTDDITFDTIYIGGGTPSLLLPEEIRNILESLKKAFPIADSPEITMEANPHTLTHKNLDEYLEKGINRISIGIQSLNDNELNLLGRLHTVSEAINGIQSAMDAGFENIGIDLIYGLPNQTLKDWQQTLMRAIDMPIRHISTYALTWHKKTTMGQKILSGKFPKPDEDTISEMYLWTSRMLTDHGYEHYEISNFAKPGYQCKHNWGYWDGTPYLGFGPAAHSFLDSQRFWNVSDVNQYINKLNHNILPVEAFESLNDEQKILEKLTLGLRTNHGIHIKDFNVDHTQIELCIKNGFAKIDRNHFILTANGFLLADEIAAKLLTRTLECL